METSIIITSETENDKRLKKTVTYVNSNAKNSDLKSFAQALNSLTKNSYVSSERIDKINLDTEEDKEARNPALKYRNASTNQDVDITNAEQPIVVPISQLQNQKTLVLNYRNSPSLIDDTSRLIISNLESSIEGTMSLPSTVNYLSGNNYQTSFQVIPEGQSNVTVSLTLSIAANDKYQAWSKDFVFNFVGGE